MMRCCSVAAGSKAKQCGGIRLIALNQADFSYLNVISNIKRGFALNYTGFICMNHRDSYLKSKSTRCIRPNCNITNSLKLKQCPKRFNFYLNLHEQAVVYMHYSCCSEFNQFIHSQHNNNNDNDHTNNNNNNNVINSTDESVILPIVRPAEIVAHDVVKHKLNQTPPNTPITLQGKAGRPLTILPISNPEVSFNNSSPEAKRHKIEHASAVIKHFTFDESATEQENQTNLNNFMTKLNHTLLDDHQDNSDCKLTSDQTLKVKVDSNASWSQFRSLSSTLNRHNCNPFPSEYSLRKRAREEYDIELETGQYITERKTAVYWVRVKSVATVLLDQLESLNDFESLTDHDGLIPPIEIWLNILGDKGGHSVKLVAAILNQQQPLSRNQLLLGIYEGDNESYSTIQRVFKPLYDQLNELAKHTDFNNRRFKLFYGGDMKWNWTVKGLSIGGRHSCIYCLSANEKQSNALRTIDHHRQQVSAYNNNNNNNNSNNNKRKALDYFNCIAEPIMGDSAFNELTPMPLHTFLGVVQDCLDLVEMRCKQLDKTLKEKRTVPLDMPNTDEFIKLFRRMDELDGEVASIDYQLSWISVAESTGADYHNSDEIKINDMIEASTRLTNNKMELYKQKGQLAIDLASMKGFFQYRLDQFLETIKVSRKSNHGHSLVGSEVHDLLLPDNIHKLTSVLCDKTIYSINDETTSLGDNIAACKMKLRLQYLAILYHLSTAPRKLHDSEIQLFKDTIDNFRWHYNLHYPHSPITPKLHALLDHFPDILDKYKTIGLFSEQGMESLHTRFKDYDNKYCNITDRIQHLVYCFKQHSLASNARIRGQ